MASLIHSSLVTRSQHMQTRELMGIYVEAIMNKQPAGPYPLGGHSQGACGPGVADVLINDRRRSLSSWCFSIRCINPGTCNRTLSYFPQLIRVDPRPRVLRAALLLQRKAERSMPRLA